MLYLFRKSFFVKPKLLFKYVIFALLTVIFTSVCILVVMRKTLYVTDTLENISNAEILKVQSALMVPFWWIVIILLIVIGIQSLIRFHRIVGPIYALEKIIELIKQGTLGGHVLLRRSDELKDLAQKVEDMSLSLKNYVQKDRKIIDEIKADLDSVSRLSNPGEIKTRLLTIKEKLSRVTGDFKINE